MFDQNLIFGLLAIAVLVGVAYAINPAMFKWMLPGSKEHFANAVASANGKKVSGAILPPNAAAKNPAALPGDAENAIVKAKAALMAPKPAGPAKEGFADYQGASLTEAMGPVPMAAAQKPAGCYPREQLNAAELLPNDPHSTWAQVNPQGTGNIQGKNFLSAGALVGVNTIGQSLRNANYQLRADIPNPQANVGPWQQSTIEPDLARRPLE